MSAGVWIYLLHFPGVFNWKFFMWNYTKQLPARLSLFFQCTRLLHGLSKKTPYKYRKEIKGKLPSMFYFFAFALFLSNVNSTKRHFIIIVLFIKYTEQKEKLKRILHYSGEWGRRNKHLSCFKIKKSFKKICAAEMKRNHVFMELLFHLIKGKVIVRHVPQVENDHPQHKGQWLEWMLQNKPRSR